MSLSENQRKRITIISKMIRGSIEAKNNIEEIQLFYAEEIKSVIFEIEKINDDSKSERTKKTIEKIKKKRQNQKSKIVDSDQKEDLLDSIDEKNFDKEIKDGQESFDKVHKWVKSLWKKIAMKCHPDRIDHFKISDLEKAKRKNYMTDAKKYLEDKNWSMILFIASEVGEFVEDTDEISYQEQKRRLEKIYSKTCLKVEDMQNSMAWQWGQSEENLTARMSLVSRLCSIHKIKTPSKKDVENIFYKLGLI